MLELAPLLWARTRARLDAKALENDLGLIAIPPSRTAEELFSALLRQRSCSLR
jgi:hypothetical protein